MNFSYQSLITDEKDCIHIGSECPELLMVGWESMSFQKFSRTSLVLVVCLIISSVAFLF